MFRHIFLSFFIINQIAVSWSQAPTDIVPLNQVTDSVVVSGVWSDPSTWGGALPINGAKVYVGVGKELIVDTLIPERIRSIRLEGALRFDPSVNTRLKVETIVGLMGSELEIGTDSTPVASNVMAEILFIDEGPIDTLFDYGQWSKGLIMMGKTRVFGSPKSTWLTLGQFPRTGDDQINLPVPVPQWSVGDDLVFTGTDAVSPELDEKRQISNIQGQSIFWSQPLTYDHIPPVSDLEVHIANLTRNIVFRSENPTQTDRSAHVMFMHNLDVQLHYMKFYQMGRTDKRIPLDDWIFPTLVADVHVKGARNNIRGRYSCHFHRGGVDPSIHSAAVVRGCVVEDDPGWAYVNHSSYVDFIDNVSYNIMGGAFQTESGNEIGAFVNNIAIRTVNPNYPILDPATADVDAREDVQDFAFQGDAFWFHGGNLTIEGNVASGASGHGFIYWTEGLREVDTQYDLQNMYEVSNIPNGNLLPGVNRVQSWWVPIKSFRNNIAYSATNGFAAYYVHATLFEDITELSDTYLQTVHSVFEDLTIWHVRERGIELQNCERFTFQRIRLINDGRMDASGIDNKQTVATSSIWNDMQISGFGQGMIPPMQGDVSICGGLFSNRWDFRLIPPQRDSRHPGQARDIRFDSVQFVDNPLFLSSDIVHFKMEGLGMLNGDYPDMLDPEFAHKFFMIPDRITVNTTDLSQQRLYYDEQEPNFIPITSANIYTATGAYRSDILNKTNQQLMNDLQLAFAGALMPPNASTSFHVEGGQVSSTDIQTISVPACHFIDEPLQVANYYDAFDFYTCWDTTSQKMSQRSIFIHNCQSNANTSVEIIDQESIKVFPNPFSDYFTISGLEAFSRLQVFTLNGQQIMDRKLNGDSDIEVYEVSTPGVYFMYLSSLEKQVSSVIKLVKMR